MILNSLVPKGKLPTLWKFSLLTYGYTTGIVGLMCRTIGLALTSILLAAETSRNAPEIIVTVLAVTLSYLSLTLMINILFITAVIRKKAPLLLPYLVVQGIELVGVLFMLISGCYLFDGIEWHVGFWLLLLMCFCMLVIQGSLCYHSVNLFREMEMNAAFQKALRNNQ